MISSFSQSNNTRKDVQERLMMVFQDQTYDECKEALEDILSEIKVVANNVEDQGETDQFNDFEASSILTTQLDRSIDEVQQYNITVQHETSSIIHNEEVFGRDDEKAEIFRHLLDSGDKVIDVLPLFGVGGIGKTTLAQQVYNDDKVNRRFNQLFWVHVSKPFDVKRLTKEILESSTTEMVLATTSLDLLQQILKKRIERKRFLLVLDDVWNEDIDKWESFLAPLKSARKGSKIIATTRSQNVAYMIATIGPLSVRGLPDHECFELFTRSLLGSKDLTNSKLDDITRTKIVSLIKGSPAVAKALGRFLLSQCGYAKSTALSDRNTDSIHPAAREALEAPKFPEPHLNTVHNIGVGDIVMQNEIKKKHGLTFPVNGIKVVGREDELEKIIHILLNQSDCSRSRNSNVYGFDVDSSEQNYNITKRRKIENLNFHSNLNFPTESYVLPIVGIGGLGKTTLAQMIFNDERVGSHFDKKIWVELNGDFDSVLLYSKIIQSVSVQIQDNLNDSNSLEQNVKENLESKKFLLVLDNIWCEHSSVREHLCTLLSWGGVGSMIMATTRSLKVAKLIGTLDHISLDGLRDDIYWDFFKICAFGPSRAKEYNDLEKIAKTIATKLGGLPLAAKLIGGILKSNLDVSYWEKISDHLTQESELRKEVNVYLPLKLSYEYMPLHLQQCFSYCSIFPKNHEFSEESLIDMWLAEGFILPKKNKKLDATAYEYLHDLVSRSFLQKSQMKPAHFVVHNLLHEWAQSISSPEILKLQDSQFQSPPTIKHSAVCIKYFDHEQQENLYQFDNLFFLVILLTSFRLDVVLLYLFERLKNLRYLKLGNCEIKNLPENISNLFQLRYLDISQTDIRVLPKSICDLGKLEILDMRGCPIQSLPNRFKLLINLRKLYMEEKIFSMINEVGRLKSLETLPQYVVENKPGHGIEQLETLKDLTRTLRLQNLDLVYSKIDACRAKLHEKRHIHKLILEWSDKRKTSFGYDNFDLDEDVLEGLRPHSNIKELQIKHYIGNRSPSWLGTHIFAWLSALLFKDCPNLKEIPQLPSSLSALELINVGLYSLPKLWDGMEGLGYKTIMRSNLFVLHIERCQNLESLENWLLPDCLPLLESIYIAYCEDLVSAPFELISEFSSLENFEIVACPNLIISPKRLTLPSSIKKLRLSHCGDLDKSLPDSLNNLEFLTTLVLIGCNFVTSLPDEVMRDLKSLSYLAIESCKELTSVEIQSVQSIKWFYVSQCKKLIDETYTVLETELQEKNKILLETLTIDHTILTQLPGLQYPPCYLRKLVIQNSPQVKIFNGKKWLSNLTLLKEIWFLNCVKLNTLPDDIYQLNSLEQIHLHDCEQLEWQYEDMLQLNLKTLCVLGCPRFEIGKKEHLVISNGCS